MKQITTELENINLQISTLGQQIDQFEHASSLAKEEKAKMKYVNRQITLKYIFIIRIVS